MHTIDLAYVGRGLHEELVAYIADQEDYYADEGVHVALRDGCAWDEERLRRGATIGLGRARGPQGPSGSGIPVPRVAGMALWDAVRADLLDRIQRSGTTLTRGVRVSRCSGLLRSCRPGPRPG
jgi:hypothetical protein